jgi:hypothetical protein
MQPPHYCRRAQTMKVLEPRFRSRVSPKCRSMSSSDFRITPLIWSSTRRWRKP